MGAKITRRRLCDQAWKSAGAEVASRRRADATSSAVRRRRGFLKKKMCLIRCERRLGMLAVLALLPFSIQASQLASMQMSTIKPAATSADFRAPSGVFSRSPLLFVPLAAWYFGRGVPPLQQNIISMGSVSTPEAVGRTLTLGDFARSGHARQLVLPNQSGPLGAGDEDVEPDEVVCSNRAALSQAEEWTRPNTSDEHATARAANHSWALGPTVHVAAAAGGPKGNGLAGGGPATSRPVWTCPAPTCRVRGRGARAGTGRYVSYRCSPYNWARHWNAHHKDELGPLADYQGEEAPEEEEPDVCQPCATETGEASCST